MKLINRTLNGQVAFCSEHGLYHLEFGNIFINLTRRELLDFAEYINSINYKYYLEYNQDTFNDRKLVLKVGSKNIMLCVHEHEFLELKALLAGNNECLISKKISFQNKIILN